MKSRRNNTEKGTSYKVSSSAHDLKFKRKSGMKLHFVRHEGRIRRAWVAAGNALPYLTVDAEEVVQRASRQTEHEYEMPCLYGEKRIIIEMPIVAEWAGSVHGFVYMTRARWQTRQPAANEHGPVANRTVEKTRN